MRTASKKSVMVALCAIALMFAGMVPASAQASSARGSSYGITASLAGTPLLDQQPACEAAIPPGAEDACVETTVEVPLEGVLESRTLTAENAVAAADGLTSQLQQERVDFVGQGVLPESWTVTSYGATEVLSVADGLVAAEVIEGEAVADCLGGQPVLATGANVANLSLAETEILAPLLDALQIDASPVLNLTQAPNTLVVDLLPLLRIHFWETNWDGATGTTDGSNTVWVNALHIEVLADGGGGGLPGLPGLPDLPIPPGSDVQVQQQQDGTVDIIVGRAEATADCVDALGGITKTASSDVVAPGSTFTYTINVPNQDPSCTLTDVRVVDTITGPAGSSIVSTTPPADAVNGLTVTWNDVGPIPPGGNVQLQIGVQVPPTAQDGEEYREQLAVTANCDGRPVDGGLDFVGPRVGGPAAPGGPQPPAAPLPRTGGAAALLGGLAFMAFGAALRRLRG